MALNVGDLIAKFELDSRNFTASIKQVEKDTTLVSKAVTKMGSRIETAMTAALATFSTRSIISFGQSIVSAVTEMEQLDRLLRFSTGSAENARRAYDFIRASSERLGISLQVAAKEFGGLAAAARNTSLDGEGVREIFLAIAEASAVMGFDAETMSRVFLAVRQMMSKGVIAAQELKLQLGEKLPGAIQILSRALGISTMELNKMLEQGALIAEDVLPRMAKEMRDTFAPELDRLANTTTSAVAKMSSAWFELKRTVVEGFVGTATTALINFGARILKFVDEFIKTPSVDTSEAFSSLSTQVTNLGKAAEKTSTTLEDTTKASSILQARVSDIAADFKSKFRDLRAELETTLGKAGVSKWEANILDVEATLDKQLTKLEDYYRTRLKVIEKGSELELALTKEYTELRGLAERAAATQIAQIRRDAVESQIGILSFAQSEITTFVDAVAESAIGIEVNFKDLLKKMLLDLNRFILRIFVVLPIVEALRNALTGGVGGGVSSGLLGIAERLVGFAKGGIIKEPVIGFGLESGISYSFAESGPEAVVPLGSAGNEGPIGDISGGNEGPIGDISGGTNNQGNYPVANNFNITINAVDSQSITDLLRRNPQAVTAPIIESLQAGDRGLMASMRGALA